jgi:hypothetical protein
MMARILVLLLTAMTLLGAEDPWTKVRQVKSGAELRIYKKGAKQPVLAKMDEANEERVLVVVKNEQVAIHKDQIDRIDYRPPQSGGRLKTESKSTTESQDSKAPSSSTSTALTVQSRPDFETIYRRPPASPQK